MSDKLNKLVEEACDYADVKLEIDSIFKDNTFINEEGNIIINVEGQLLLALLNRQFSREFVLKVLKEKIKEVIPEKIDSDITINHDCAVKDISELQLEACQFVGCTSYQQGRGIRIDVNEKPRDVKPTLNTNSRRDIKTGPSGNSYPAPKRSRR